MGGKGVPVLLIDGEVVRGFNEKTIVAALGHWQGSQAQQNASGLEPKQAKNKKSPPQN